MPNEAERPETIEINTETVNKILTEILGVEVFVDNEKLKLAISPGSLLTLRKKYHGFEAEDETTEQPIKEVIIGDFRQAILEAVSNTELREELKIKQMAWILCRHYNISPSDLPKLITGQQN